MLKQGTLLLRSCAFRYIMQVVADFILEHRVDVEHDDSLFIDINFIFFTPWKLSLMDQLVVAAKVLTL
jgi:hypothetical protein